MNAMNNILFTLNSTNYAEAQDTFLTPSVAYISNVM